MTITEFLTARYDEDETWANAARGWQTGSRHESQPLDWSIHMRRWSPENVLADIAAKRAIMADHERIEDWRPICARCFKEHGWPESMWEDTMHEWPCPTIRLLAQPYVEHPDFDTAWRVS